MEELQLWCCVRRNTAEPSIARPKSLLPPPKSKERSIKCRWRVGLPPVAASEVECGGRSLGGRRCFPDTAASGPRNVVAGALAGRLPVRLEGRFEEAGSYGVRWSYLDNSESSLWLPSVRTNFDVRQASALVRPQRWIASVVAPCGLLGFVSSPTQSRARRGSSGGAMDLVYGQKWPLVFSPPWYVLDPGCLVQSRLILVLFDLITGELRALALSEQRPCASCLFCTQYTSHTRLFTWCSHHTIWLKGRERLKVSRGKK